MKEEPNIRRRMCWTCPTTSSAVFKAIRFGPRGQINDPNWNEENDLDIQQEAEKNKKLTGIWVDMTDEEIPLIEQIVIAVYDVAHASAASNAWGDVECMQSLIVCGECSKEPSRAL